MNLSFSQNIKIDVTEENFDLICNELNDEFKKISEKVNETDDGLCAESINASFGSILRKDISNVRIKENRKRDGYIINCDTVYKPSVAFWIFCVIDFFLVVTLIGFVIALGVTLGLYFYNKSLVEKAIRGALDKVQQNVE